MTLTGCAEALNHQATGNARLLAARRLRASYSVDELPPHCQPPAPPINVNPLWRGSIGKGLLLFALPILYGNVLQTLNASVNSIWVGRFLGEAALTATSNANTSAVPAARWRVRICRWRRASSSASISAASGWTMPSASSATARPSSSCSRSSSPCWVRCSPNPILMAMKTPPDSLQLAVQYTRVIFYGLPFSFMYAFVVSVLRGAGDSKTPLPVPRDVGDARHPAESSTDLLRWARCRGSASPARPGRRSLRKRPR